MRKVGSQLFRKYSGLLDGGLLERPGCVWNWGTTGETAPTSFGKRIVFRQNVLTSTWLLLPALLRDELPAQLGSLCGDCFHQALLRGKITECSRCFQIYFEAHIYLLEGNVCLSPVSESWNEQVMFLQILLSSTGALFLFTARD